LNSEEIQFSFTENVNPKVTKIASQEHSAQISSQSMAADSECHLMVVIRIVFLLQMMVDRGRAVIHSDKKDYPAVNPNTHKEPIPSDKESSNNEDKLKPHRRLTKE
jgi:hypothetical protein